MPTVNQWIERSASEVCILSVLSSLLFLLV